MLALLFGVALAADPAHVIQPDDLFTIDGVAHLAVDRTGARVAWVLGRWDEAADRRVQDVWVSEAGPRGARVATRLTFTEQDESGLEFSPDGRWLYFKRGSAKHGERVWRVAVDGSREQPVTPEDQSVSVFEVGADAVWYLTSDDAPVDDEWAALRKAHSSVRYGYAPVQKTEAWRLDLSSWKAEVAAAPGRSAYDLSVSPDGRYVAMLTSPDDPLVWREGWSELFVWDRSAGARVAIDDALWRAQAPSPYGWLIDLAWSSDGLAVAFRVDYDGFPGETFVAELAGGVANVWQLPRPEEAAIAGDGLAWVPDSRELCMIGSRKGRDQVLCVDKVRAGTAGRARFFPEGNVVVRQYAFSGDGRDVYADIATPTAFGEVYRLPARGRTLPQRVTDLNPHTASWRLPELKVVSWKSADGTPVEGILELPAGWTPEQGPLPTMVVIHGGPTSHARYARTLRPTGEGWLAGQGFAVLLPNYRGSTSYGDAFLTGLVGHENEVDVADILAGVDELVRQGVADPERLAVGGWSNGGYLTGCTIAATDRFKAAILGAGVYDMSLQWLLEDTPGHVVNFMQGQPWEKPEAYQAASPLYAADRITTPTLIHVGSDDPRVPAAHAQGLFRTLSLYREVPVELMEYPGAGHGLRQMSHLKAKLAWDAAWLRRWVLGER
jgi:dipeptidyl aminopeptidase/acylaminoacyl peptidase